MSFRQTGSFVATDDSGNRYTILEYTEYRITNDLSGRSEFETGYKKLRTSTGHDVTPVVGSRNKLQIIKGINWPTVTTDDPRYQNM